MSADPNDYEVVANPNDFEVVIPTASTTEVSPAPIPESPSGIAREAGRIVPDLPEEIKVPIQAAAETAEGFIPRSALQVAELATPLVGAAETIASTPKKLSDVLFGRKSVAEAFPESQLLSEAEKTPAFSKERYKAGFEVLGSLGMGAAIGRGLTPKPASLTETLFGKETTPEITAVNEGLARVERESNAIKEPQTAQTYGNVLNAPRPEESTGQVPTSISSERIPKVGQGTEVPGGPQEVAPVSEPTEAAKNLGVEIPPTVSETAATGQAEPVEQPPITVPEVTNEQSRLTSTKNEVVDAERKARGLEPIVSEIHQSHPEIMDEAATKLTENPNYGKVVVDDLVNGSKTEISRLDEAVLLREKIATQNAKRDAGRRALDETLSEPERIQAKQEFDDLEAHNNDIDQATYRSGTMWGELGRFRQRLAAEDYSLVGAEQRLRVAKGNKPLTLEESNTLKTETEKISDLQSKINARRERLEKSVAERKGLIEKRQRAKGEIPADVEIETLETELSTLKSQQAEEARLPKAKERTQKRIDEINQRIKDYGFAKETKKEPVVQDRELVDLQYALSKAKETLDRGVFKAQMDNQSLPQKIFRTAGEVLSLPRALKASMDLSAVRRQGGQIFMAHPIRALKNFPPMLKAARSEKGYFEVMQEIRDRPNAPLYRQSKLSLTDVDPTAGLSQMEEVYMSRWANAIPLVNHSQRAYVAFLNRLRADSFDAMANSLGKGGKITADQANAISNFINVFTGRGAMTGKYADAAAAMNQAFFAPRYAISRFQSLIGQPLYKGDLAVKKVIAKEYARTLIGYGVMYGLIGMAAKEAVEFDPRSSDFGKIKFGNTRLDPLSGLSQATVVISRLSSGRTKTEAGEVRKIYGDVPFGKTTAMDVGARFLRSKLAPVPSSAVNFLQGQDFTGQPVTPISTIKDLVLPLSGSDIVEAMQEQGVPRGAALGALAFFGDGLQTYSPRIPKAGKTKSVERKTSR